MYSQDICHEVSPELVRVGDSAGNGAHTAACHFADGVQAGSQQQTEAVATLRERRCACRG